MLLTTEGLFFTEQHLRERYIAGFTDELMEGNQEWITINGRHVMLGGHEPQSQRLSLEQLRSVALAHDDLKTHDKAVTNPDFHRGKVVGHLASALALKHSKSLKEAHAKLGALHKKAVVSHGRAATHKSHSFHAGFKEAAGHHMANVHAVITAGEQMHGRHRHG
jgi:hypothetical protein